MSPAIFEVREQYIEKLYRLLPGVYRARDETGDLRAFLGLFADELLRLRAGLDQQLADHFVDSAQDWVLPYIADLVGTDLLSTDGARNRVDIQNTVRWRRAKGTLAGLEEMAAGVSGWGALARDMLDRLGRVQALPHLRPRAGQYLDLRDRDAMAALNTPFSRAGLSADLRPLAARATDAVGLARSSVTAVHVWPVPSHPLRGCVPVAAGGGRFRFSALGLDLTLHAGGDRSHQTGGDLAAGHADHVPLRIRDVSRHLPNYLNSPVGFAILEDGIPVCDVAAGGVVDTPSLQPAAEFAELAQARGMIAGDISLFGAGQRFEVQAVRLGAVIDNIGGQPAPVTYSPGLPLANQLLLLASHGTLQLDGAVPDFSYAPGGVPYSPNTGEHHHAALLLRLANSGAVAPFPESEIVVRNSRGQALQVFLPALAVVPAGQSLYLYVSSDGSTWHARGDHDFGMPDRNPDRGPYGAFALQHLARAAEAQVRLTPGHPAGPTRVRRAVIRSLCCWDKPLVPALTTGQVAIDPERGRFMFPAGEVPQGRLTVDYRYALTARIGAGPFDRGELPPATLTVARDCDAQYASLQAAINAAPDGAAAPVVIEIRDSATYEEVLNIANRNFPGGLRIQAAALQTPAIIKPAGPSPALRLQNSTLALAFSGLTFAGGDWQLQGAIGAIELIHCTLTPASVAVDLVSPDARLTLRSCICGPITITAPSGRVDVADSVIQHPASTVEQPQGQLALSTVNVDCALDRCTLLGDFAARAATVSNSLLFGGVVVTDPAASCWRFSRLPAALHPPRAFRITSAVPQFVSLRFGAAGYCHLHPNTAAALRAGGEEGAEIGVFHQAGVSLRLQGLTRRLNEYTPAGVTAFVIPVLPRLPFRGNLPT